MANQGPPKARIARTVQGRMRACNKCLHVLASTEGEYVRLVRQEFDAWRRVGTSSGMSARAVPVD